MPGRGGSSRLLCHRHTHTHTQQGNAPGTICPGWSAGPRLCALRVISDRPCSSTSLQLQRSGLPPRRCACSSVCTQRWADCVRWHWMVRPARTLAAQTGQLGRQRRMQGPPRVLPSCMKAQTIPGAHREQGKTASSAAGCCPCCRRSSSSRHAAACTGLVSAPDLVVLKHA